MPRMITSAVVEDVRGSLGGITFSSWKGVGRLQRKTSPPSGPSSEYQAHLRTVISEVSKRWHNTLTQAQRDGWEDYAKKQGSAADSKDIDETGIQNVIPNNRKIMSGYHAFVMNNSTIQAARLSFPVAYVDDVPVSAPPNPPTNFVCQCRSIGGINVIVGTWVDPVGVATPPPNVAFIRPWLVSYDAGVHKQILLYVPLGIQGGALTNIRIAGGQTTQVGKKPGHYLCQLDCIDIYGQKSPPSNVSQMEVTSDLCPAFP